MRYFLLSSLSDRYVKASLETGLWALTKEEDLLLNHAQNLGSVTLIIKHSDDTQFFGVLQLRDTKSPKCIVLFAKLPYQLAIRWRGITASAVCKISWQLCETISTEMLNLTKIKLSDGSERYFNEFNRVELSQGCGKEIVNMLLKTSVYAHTPQMLKRYPILYLNPEGYYITLMKFSRIQIAVTNNRLISKTQKGEKFLTRYSLRHPKCNKLSFDELSYIEYIECFNKIKLIRKKGQKKY